MMGGMTTPPHPAPSTETAAPGRAEVTVREASLADLPAIVDLLAEGAQPDPAPYAAGFARIVGGQGGAIGIAEIGGQVVGVLQLAFIASLLGRGEVTAHIEGVRTLSSLRGRGIGEALFAWAEEESARRGAVHLRITVDSARVNEHRFYEHLGYRSALIGFAKDLGRPRRG